MLFYQEASELLYSLYLQDLVDPPEKSGLALLKPC